MYSKVEHPFRLVKVQCGFFKNSRLPRYHEKSKPIEYTVAIVNLWMCLRAGRSLKPIMCLNKIIRILRII